MTYRNSQSIQTPCFHQQGQGILYATWHGQKTKIKKEVTGHTFGYLKEVYKTCGNRHVFPISSQRIQQPQSQRREPDIKDNGQMF